MNEWMNEWEKIINTENIWKKIVSLGMSEGYLSSYSCLFLVDVTYPMISIPAIDKDPYLFL